MPFDTEATGSKTMGAGALLSSLLFLSLSLSFSGASLSKTHMGEGQNKSNAQRIDKILKYMDWPFPASIWIFSHFSWHIVVQQ